MKRIIPLLLSLICLTGCPDKTEFRGLMSNKHTATSPKGVRIFSPNPITNQGAAIDRGLDKAFAIAEAPPNNYSVFTRHNTYTVYLWPRSNKCQNPAIYQFWDRATVYDQTEYDKDPRVGKTGLCFAGIQKFNGTASRNENPDIRPGMLIVDDASTIETVTWYEAEHNILIQADYPRWIATKDLHLHPILGSAAGGSNFAVAEFDLPRGERLHGLITK